jgi:agmatine deiminase
MPAEWEPRAATWLAWPKDPVTFPGKMLREVEGIYLQMVRALAWGERVHILVNDPAEEAHVTRLLESEGLGRKRVHLHTIQTADVWIRDYGPTFLVGERGLAFAKWTFNAWGNKYPSLLADDGVPERIRKIVKVPAFRAGVVMEGGAIDVNGRGSLLTTEECLLNRNRNPRLTRSGVERVLREFTAAQNILWLARGVKGDDTDGHVDELARFADPRTVLCALDPDRRSDNHAALKENFRRLVETRDEEGEPFEVRPLPMPGRLYRPRGVPYGGARLPASYANFYVGSRVVLQPIYGHRNDAKAVEIVEEAFPKREVVPIRCEALVNGFGSIHCVTQQEPKA